MYPTAGRTPAPHLRVRVRRTESHCTGTGAGTGLRTTTLLQLTGLASVLSLVASDLLYLLSVAYALPLALFLAQLLVQLYR